jgi:hypothetical protein
LRAVGDYLIRIKRQHGKNFRAVRRGHVRTAAANGDLALARGASVT